MFIAVLEIPMNSNTKEQCQHVYLLHIHNSLFWEQIATFLYWIYICEEDKEWI